MEVSTQGGHMFWLIAGIEGSWAGKGLPSTSPVKSCAKNWAKTYHSVVLLLVTVAELLTPFFVSSGLLCLYAFSLLWMSLLNFLSEESLQHVRCVMLSFKSFQKATSNFQASCPFGFGRSAKSAGHSCVWKEFGPSVKGWMFLLTFGGAGSGEETLHASQSPRTPGMAWLLLSVAQKKEGSLAFQSEVIPVINTQSKALWRNNVLLQQNSRTDLLPAVKWASGDWICSLT